MNQVPLFLGAGLLAIAGFVTFAGEAPEKAPAVAASAPQEESPAAEDAPEPAPQEEAQTPAAAETEEAEPTPNPAQDDTVLAAGLGPVDAAAATPETPAEKPAKKAKRPRSPRAKVASSSKSEPAAPTMEAPKPPAPPAAQVAEALDAGWMLESQSSLLIFPSTKPVDWAAAKSLCQRRSDAGLRQWRLARQSELKALRASRSLPAGTWWSSSDADDASQALTLAPTQAGELSKVDGAALTLCVHARPVS